MRVLAVDSEHDYFLLGCTLEEVNKKIIPQQEDLLERYSHDVHKTYYVSSAETREKELKDQALVKANPYQSKTRIYGILIHEEPTFDAYVVVRRDLAELYFVPFDFVYPAKWGDHNPWGNTVKKEIKSLIELTKLPMVNEKGEAYDDGEVWTNGDAEALLADYLDAIEEWKEKGPLFVYRTVMAQFQKYRLNHHEIEMLMAKGGVKLPMEWYEMDSAHRHIAGDYLKKRIKPEPETKSFRNTEQEKEHIMELIQLGYDDDAITGIFYDEFLDDCFTWKTFMECIPEGDEDRYADLQNIPNEERKRKLWRFVSRLDD